MRIPNDNGPRYRPPCLLALPTSGVSPPPPEQPSRLPPDLLQIASVSAILFLGFGVRACSATSGRFANDSIELLRQSGIDFMKTMKSGYDFGYLLKLLRCKNLPDTQAGFFNLINMYFPVLYDIKHLMKLCNSLHGGLNKLTELLEVERVA
ncbi:hypothetical protein AAG906_020373 [Vitis piasezkii]